MTRVLHLLDEPAGESAALALRLSADAARCDGLEHEQHAWLLVGGESIRAAARSAGIAPDRARLMPRPEGIRRCVPGSMRAMKALMDRADRIECWTVGGATLAARLGCELAVPRFGQATLCGYAQRIIAETLRVASSSPAGSGTGGDSERSSEQTRQVNRRSWGVDDGTFVVALLADQPARVDAREAFMSVAFAFETLAAAKVERGDVRLLCHPSALRRVDANGLAELLKQPQLVLQDPRALSPWAALPGCDFALAPDPMHAGLSILWADALGVPVIAPPEARQEMLGELARVQPCQSGAAKHLAHPLTQWALQRQPAAVANA